MRPTLELILDLLREVRELMQVELALVRTEISERAAGIPTSLAAVVVGLVLLPVALGLLLVAAALFLTRFGLAPDVAFLIVAAATIVVSLLCLWLGAAGLRPSRLLCQRDGCRTTARHVLRKKPHKADHSRH